MKKRNETDYKRWLRKDWCWFQTNVEYGRGGAAGFPDLVFKHPFCRDVLFVETKVGEVKLGELHISDIRKEQFAWLRDFAHDKGFAFVFVGVPLKIGWKTFVLPYPSSPEFKKAFTERKINVSFCLELNSPLNSSHHSILLGWQGGCDRKED